MEETKIICPVCSQVVSDFEEGISDPCEHVLIIYTDILSGEFVHVAEGAEEVAATIMAKYDLDGEDGDKGLDELIAEYAEANGHEVVELTTYGMSCGPCSSTEYIMFKGE